MQKIKCAIFLDLIDWEKNYSIIKIDVSCSPNKINSSAGEESVFPCRFSDVIGGITAHPGVVSSLDLDFLSFFGLLVAAWENPQLSSFQPPSWSDTLPRMDPLFPTTQTGKPNSTFSFTVSPNFRVHVNYFKSY